jgi:hypothetical protein
VTFAGEISRAGRRTASALLIGLLGCGGQPTSSSAPTPKVAPVSSVPTKVLPMAQLFAAGVSATAPRDTTVTVSPSRGRTIILRHPEPDEVVFAVVVLPPNAFDSTDATPVKVTIRPTPGIYGLGIETTRPLANPGSVTFTYARFFAAPPDAITRYGSAVVFERSLEVGHVLADGTVATLPSDRPGPDQLHAPLPAAGRYLVVGLR